MKLDNYSDVHVTHKKPIFRSKFIVSHLLHSECDTSTSALLVLLHSAKYLYIFVYISLLLFFCELFASCFLFCLSSHFVLYTSQLLSLSAMSTSPIPVLVAGHSQAKYFHKYFSPESRVVCKSFSGYKVYETRRVILPNVQQQQNSVDCGIFAIAFLVELCANGFNNLMNSTFDVSEMRNHLSVCIENKHFQPFPKTQDNVKPKRSNPIIYEIEADCNSCTLPNIFDDMIGCENGDCEFWYHMKCVDINKTISDSLKFICDHCNEPLT